MEALDYIKKIEKAGFESYIVGGYVRDFLLGLKSDDIDVATNAHPKDIAIIFDVELNDRFGSVHIEDEGFNIDITTYRKDGKYDEHHPKTVCFVSDLKRDLKRRDFTVNAICMDSDGNIVDPLNGQKDLNDRVIKTIGRPSTKFKEDPLRVLRALRFAICYDFHLGKREFAYILKHRNCTKTVSYYRKKGELERIFESPKAINGLDFLKSLNLLKLFGVNYEGNLIYTENPLGIWSQIEFGEGFEFTKKEYYSIQAIRKMVSSKTVDKMAIFTYGIDLSLVAAQILGLKKENIQKLAKSIPIREAGEICVNGDDIIEILKLSNRKELKEIKDDLCRNIVLGSVKNEKKAIRQYLLKKWK